MKIKRYPTTLELTNIEGRDEEANRDVIDFDGWAGEYTRSETIDSLTDAVCDGGKGLTIEQAEQVCDVLETTSNVEFFQEEE